MKYDVLIAGVGGQGTVLASRLIAQASIEEGYFTRTSETIGMAQRGGCVVSHVRIGSKELSSIIPVKNADLLIGFEVAEAARNLYRLKESGKCVINNMTVKPVSSMLGKNSYNLSEINEYIKTLVPSALFVDGYNLAESAGSVKAINMVLLGAAVSKGMLPFSRETMEKVMKNNIPSKYLDLNLKAFNMLF